MTDVKNKNKKKKEKKVQDQDAVIKQSTALIIAAGCLVVGFLVGMFYSTIFNEDKKVRKTKVKQPTPQVRIPRARIPGTAPPQYGAISTLEKEVTANPQNVDAWARLGHAYFDANQFEKAINAYKKHLELNPNNADVWTDMGVMYRRKGKPDEALRSFNKAIEINPRHQQSRFNKGIVLMHDLKNPEAGLKAWEELVSIYPDARTQEGTPLIHLIKKFRSSMPSEK